MPGHGSTTFPASGSNHNRPEHVNAFSAPVFDAEGHMILALSLTTPASRMSPDWDGAGPRALAAAAARLSTDLGHQQYGSKA
jgi:DNA-binding IclR family transcriptional regulator